MKSLLSKILPKLAKSKLTEQAEEKLKTSSKTEKGLWAGVIVLVLAAVGIELSPETAQDIMAQAKALLNF